MDFLRQVVQFLFPPSLLSWQTLILVLLILTFLTFWVFNFSFGEILILVAANKILKEVWQVIKPPTWDSWQALIWISVFSWAVSSLAIGNTVQGIIASQRLAVSDCWFALGDARQRGRKASHLQH